MFTYNFEKRDILPRINKTLINPSQSTHNKLTEAGTEEALKKLEERYKNLDVEATYKEINTFFKIVPHRSQTPPKFSSTDPMDVLKFKAAQRALWEIQTHPTNYYSRANFALPYVWRAIHDEKSLINSSTQELLDLLVEHLYEIKRGNNLVHVKDKETHLMIEKDNLRADDMICPDGTYNKVMHTLNRVHPDANIIVVNNNTALLKFHALIKACVMQNIENYINQSEENKQEFFASNPRARTWYMPKGLKNQIKYSESLRKAQQDFIAEFKDIPQHSGFGGDFDLNLDLIVHGWKEVEITQTDLESGIFKSDPAPLKAVRNLRRNGKDYGTDRKYIDFLLADFEHITDTGNFSDFGCELFLTPYTGNDYTKSDKHHLHLHRDRAGKFFYSPDGKHREELTLPPGFDASDLAKCGYGLCKNEQLAKAVVNITTERGVTYPVMTSKDKALLMKLRAGCQPQPDRPLTEAEKQLYMDQMIANAYYLMRQEHFLGRSALADEFKEMINSPEKLGFGVKYGDFFRVPSNVSGIAHGPNIARPTLVVDTVNKQKRTIYITERQQQYFVLESMALVNKKILHQGEMSLLAMIGSFKNFMKAHYPDPLFRLFEDSELDKYNELIPNHLPMNEQQRRACEKLKMQLILCDLIKDKKLSKANVGTLLNLHDLQKRMVERPFTATLYQLKLHLRHLRHTDRERLKAFIARIEAIGSLPSSEQEKYELLKKEIADTRVSSTEVVRSKVNCLFSCFASSNLATALKEFKHQVVDKLDKSVLNNENNGNNVSGPSDMFDFNDGPSNNPIVFPEGPDQEDDNHNLNLDM